MRFLDHRNSSAAGQPPRRTLLMSPAMVRGRGDQRCCRRRAGYDAIVCKPLRTRSWGGDPLPGKTSTPTANPGPVPQGGDVRRARRARLRGRAQADPEHPFNQKVYQGAAVLVARAQFRGGSSREHAPESLHSWGCGHHRRLVRRDLLRNCTTLGSLPYASHGRHPRLQRAIGADPGEPWPVDVKGRACVLATARSRCRSPTAALSSARQRHLNAMTVLLEAGDAIDATAAASLHQKACRFRRVCTHDPPVAASRDHRGPLATQSRGARKPGGVAPPIGRHRCRFAPAARS